MPVPSGRETILDGRYRLVEPIGHGGTSVVWRAHDQVLHRYVAVKVLGDGGERFRRRLRLEASTAGRLRNSYIAHIYDYGEVTSDDGTTSPYLVMELVDGQPLTRRLADGAALDWRTAVEIAAQVAAALAAAHVEGLVHRDVKPDNVLLTADGVKLIDFGISAAVGSDDTETDGRMPGTAAYLAPERLTGAPAGPAADVYALGVLLYRMIAGVLPWPETDRDGLLHAHQNLDPDPLPLTGDTPPELAEVCAECLRKDPSQRPTAAELASRLSGLVAHDDIPPIIDPTMQLPPVAGIRAGHPRTRRTIVALAAVAGCITAVLIGWAGSDAPTGPATGVLSATESCTATYAVRQDSGTEFSATLTVVNTGAAVHGWRITFNFIGGQNLSLDTSTVVTVSAGDQGRQTATLRQNGGTVTVSSPQQTLGSRDSVTLPVTGRHSGTNPVPADFRLNDRPCTARVTGVTARPAPPAGGGTTGVSTSPGTSAPATGATTPSVAPSPGTTAPTTPPDTTPPASPPPTTAAQPSTTAPPATQAPINPAAPTSAPDLAGG